MAHEEQYIVHTAMRASELRERARQFADELALRLEQINQEYGTPQGMSPEQL